MQGQWMAHRPDLGAARRLDMVKRGALDGLLSSIGL